MLLRVVFSISILLSLSSFVHAMGKRLPDTGSNYQESNAGNCQHLANYAKNPAWSLQAPPGSKADYIMADKKRRMLHLLQNGRLIRTYRIGLGDTPVGDKKCQGDGKTPEGIYNIGYKNSASSFHLSLAVSYPNQDDINEARRLGCSPGGDIMVHGLPNERWKWPFINHPSDWTQGCMAVKNNEIEEIWALVPQNTPIEICK